MMAVVLCTSSCIYDAPGDKFYRTLWKSVPFPFESLDTDSSSDNAALTVEFLCGRCITVQDSAGKIIAYGTYTPDGYAAIFAGLEFSVGNVVVTFTQAQRNGDSLDLQWQVSTQRITHTLSLYRLSAYEVNP